MIERRQLQEDTRNIHVLGFGATYTKCFTVINIVLPGRKLLGISKLRNS